MGKEGIRDLIYSTPLFDDHEHLLSLPALMDEEDSYLSFVGYAEADLLVSQGPQSPGISPFPESPGPDYDKVFFSAWKQSRNTGYCRAIERACKELFGIEFGEENVEAIAHNLKALKSNGSVDIISHILHEKAGIRWVIHDSIGSPGDIADEQYPPFIRASYRDDPLLVAFTRDTILQREARWNLSIHTLDDLVDGFMGAITECIATNKLTAFKIGLAYSRGLDFGCPTKAEAEKAFNRMMYVRQGEKVLRHYERIGVKKEAPAIPQLSGSELRPLHDYLVHVYIRRAHEEDKPVQIHTGYLGGIYKDLRNSNPLQLVPLFLHYPTTRFDIFHAGWPYTGELAAIGKHYPNVWLSLCWAWAINPISMVRTLDSWLDGVPHNKIIGFGGDTKHPIAAYGYAQQAREGIARVFEKRLARADMDRSLAEEAARAILLTNGCELHGLTEG